MALKRPLVISAGQVTEIAAGDYVRPVDIAVAVNSTTPNPGSAGVSAWSSVANSMLVWDGASWKMPAHPSSGALLAQALGYAMP